MALADALPPARKLGGCTIGALLERLKGDDLATLEAWIADEKIQGERIAVALRDALGFATTGQTVNRHRRGVCRCDPR